MGNTVAGKMVDKAAVYPEIWMETTAEDSFADSRWIRTLRLLRRPSRRISFTNSVTWGQHRRLLCGGSGGW